MYLSKSQRIYKSKVLFRPRINREAEIEEQEFFRCCAKCICDPACHLSHKPPYNAGKRKCGVRTVSTRMHYEYFSGPTDSEDEFA